MVRFGRGSHFVRSKPIIFFAGTFVLFTFLLGSFILVVNERDPAGVAQEESSSSLPAEADRTLLGEESFLSPEVYQEQALALVVRVNEVIETAVGAALNERAWPELMAAPHTRDRARLALGPLRDSLLAMRVPKETRELHLKLVLEFDALRTALSDGRVADIESGLRRLNALFGNP